MSDGARAEAAEKRRQAMQERTSKPQLAERSQRASRSGDNEMIVHDRYLAFPSEIRAETVERDGKAFYKVEGYASVFERAYEMWDIFGPYDEVVDKRAADATLAAKPDVVFLINHKGLSLARTGGPWNGNSATLELSADSDGLRDVAFLNPERSEVKDLMLAMDDGVVTEQSFAFMIDDGEWSDDFSEFRINRFNIDRGDVSAVNYGANPFTSIAARQQEILTDLRMAGPAMARAAMHALLKRDDLDIDSEVDRLDKQLRQANEAAAEPESNGLSLAYVEAMLS